MGRARGEAAAGGQEGDQLGAAPGAALRESGGGPHGRVLQLQERIRKLTEEKALAERKPRR